MYPSVAPIPDLFAAWGGLPLQLEVSQLGLVVILTLVSIFIAAVSVILVYHWRRFPFEHDLFLWVERLYLAGVVVLLTVAVIGIFLS